MAISPRMFRCFIMVAGTSSFISFRALLPNVSAVDRLETLPTFALSAFTGCRFEGSYTPGPYKKVPWVEPSLYSRPCVKALFTGAKPHESHEIDTIISHLIGREIEELGS